MLSTADSGPLVFCWYCPGSRSLMDVTLYHRAMAVFLAAIDAPPGERARIVSEDCGNDSDLRREVEGLLEADARPSHETMAPAAPILRAIERSQSLVGRTIGRYFVAREIGAGGMGRVYEGVQDSPRRSVALKVMRPLVATREVLRRFEFESEVLARLRHPGIVQVYEAGILRDGDEAFPWFAMEFIEGARPLGAFVKEQRLGLRERLRLFAEVCDAVHHGHQRGIVHRDLKPGNVLVDGEGHPKVIDFGVAKSTNSDVALTTLHTQVGELVGTLEYMSPEQCDGDPNAIDARSDVYSLGILLYELVCERSPYDLAGKSLPSAARIVREQEPERPSVIRRSLRGDLEAIVLEAIEKDPARRYSSAAALAEDLRRFVEGKPVEARSPSRWMLLMRAVARHPVRATAAACAALVLVTIGSMLLGAYLVGRVPERVSIDPDRRRVRLESRAGRELAKWDLGADNSIGFAMLVDRPPELGGGRVVVIGAVDTATWRYGPELCAFDIDHPDRLLWSTADQPLVLPAGEPERPESRFCCGSVLLEDVFSSSLGPELIVQHRNSTYSQQTIRIFDLSGRLRYQAWNDGAMFSLRWLPGVKRLVVAGLDSEKRWEQVGFPFEDSDAQYPAVIFALEPRDGHLGGNRWIVRGGRRQDETLAWYRWLGPVERLDVLGVVMPSFSGQATSFDPASHVKCDFALRTNESRQPKPGLHFVLDGDGRVAARNDDDGYKPLKERGVLPAPETYELLDYERMPR
jgi:hypothetical protein